MYRHCEKRRKMDEDQNCVVKRVGSYPVVVSALSQFTNLYGRAKEGNRLVKYTLESAESVTRKVTDTAAPMYSSKLVEGKLNSLNSIACNQLDKLEEKYPIITKPTEEVIDETKKVYESIPILKPTIDKVTSVTKYGVDTVTGVTSYTRGKVHDVKDYTCSTVNDVKDYGVGKVVQVKDYGTQKLGVALQTPYGQKLVTYLDGAMDVVDVYVDLYLPASDEEKDDIIDEEKDDKGTEKVDTLTHAISLSTKVRHRMYNRAMKDLTNLQTRSKDTLQKLNFTVDLIQYAKLNIDTVHSSVNGSVEKFRDIWEEINREGDDETTDDQKKTLERRIIQTARHLSLQLKHGFNMGKDSATGLPDTVVLSLEQARLYSIDLFNSFKQVTNYNDLSYQFMENVQDKMSYMQQVLGTLSDYIVQSWPVNKLAGHVKDHEEAGHEDKLDEVEMEELN